MNGSAGKASLTTVIVAGTIFLAAAMGVAGVMLVSDGGSDDEPVAGAGDSEAAPELPGGAVAVIGGMPDGDYVITEEDFERSLEQMAAQMELAEGPEREDPQWNEVARNTMMTELDVAWLKGEAAERDIEVTGTQVNRQLDMIATREFECDPEVEPFECDEFREFMDDIGFTEDEVIELTEVGVLSSEILNRVTEEAPELTEGELQDAQDEFFDEFVERWTARTVCAEDFLFERCSNADGRDVFAAAEEGR